MSQFAPRKSPLDDDLFGHAPFAERMAASIWAPCPSLNLTQCVAMKNQTPAIINTYTNRATFSA